MPYLFIAALLLTLKPLTAPVAAMALVIAWVVPELYAARGANVLRAHAPGAPGAEQVAVGLLGDLLDHGQRELHARTGFVLERGRFGVWLIGEAGAVLVRPNARRVYCYCVKATDSGLPVADRTAHLLLALRADEAGFATVANVAFCGGHWRLRRRLGKQARCALEATRNVG